MDEVIVNLASQTLFTVNQVKELSKHFMSCSILDDGLVRKEQFPLTIFKNNTKRNVFANQIFDLFDVNREGVIDFNNFVKSLNVFHPDAELESKIDFAFRLYDIHNNGFIERQGLRNMLIAHRVEFQREMTDDEVMETLLDNTFMDADLNQDGEIDIVEWREYVSENPSLLNITTIPYLQDLTAECDKLREAHYSPSCCCFLCHRATNSKEKLFACSQCNSIYHLTCLKDFGLQNDRENQWYCRVQCSSICFWLRQLVGKPIPVGAATRNLSWTLLSTDDKNDIKFQGAVNVLGHFFGSDTAVEVISGKGVYKGFYSAVIFRGEDEVLCASTVRFHQHVAEVAYVATRQSFQKQGLCRLMMNAWAKHVVPLGVDELVFHSTHAAVNTWKNFFGSEDISNSNRFPHCNFLQFADTVMCHKRLI